MGNDKELNLDEMEQANGGVHTGGSPIPQIVPQGSVLEALTAPRKDVPDSKETKPHETPVKLL